MLARVNECQIAFSIPPHNRHGELPRTAGHDFFSIYSLAAAARMINTLCLSGLASHRRNVLRSRSISCAILRFREPGMMAHWLSYLRKFDQLMFREVVMSALGNAGLLVLRNRCYADDGGVSGAVWVPKISWLVVQVKRYASHIQWAHLLDFRAYVQCQHFEEGAYMHKG